jgi:hypothetical protein
VALSPTGTSLKPERDRERERERDGMWEGESVERNGDSSVWCLYVCIPEVDGVSYRSL